MSTSSGVSCVTTRSWKPCSLSCCVFRRSSPVRLVRKVLRRMRNIQARKFVPSRKLLTAFSALANVSCTRSRASSGSPHIQRAKLYSGSNNGSASFSNSCLEMPLTSPRLAVNVRPLRLLSPLSSKAAPAEWLALSIFNPDDSTFLCLLHDNFCGHPGMERAEVLIRARLVKLVFKFFVRIHHLRFEKLVCAGHVVRDIITVRPMHCAARLDRYSGRVERKVIDLHRCLLFIWRRRSVYGDSDQHHA